MGNYEKEAILRKQLAFQIYCSLFVIKELAMGLNGL